MKIMTLNTHSLAEPEYESKLAAFAGSLVQIKPDIIALQEVNQSRSAPPAASGWLRESGYVPCCAKDLNTVSPCASRAVIRADNHALNLALLLARAGVSYQWTWTPAKVGYGIYDEGLPSSAVPPYWGPASFTSPSSGIMKTGKPEKYLESTPGQNTEMNIFTVSTWVGGMTAKNPLRDNGTA